MRRLLQSTRSYALLKAEKEENRLNHAYLLIFDDARNLKTALKEFAKIFLTRKEILSLRNGFSNSLTRRPFPTVSFFPRKGKNFPWRTRKK